MAQTEIDISVSYLSRKKTIFAAMREWNPRMKFGAIVAAVFVVFGFIVPIFSPGNPTVWNTVPGDLSPSWQHLFGTTDLGQDTFWLLADSVKNSLIIGVFVSFFATLIGVLVGLVAGFKGGFLDRILTLLTDTFIVVPSLPILILIASMLRGKGSLLIIAIVLTLFNWPWPARQARAMGFSLREREFINTAMFSGESLWKIIAYEIFPYVRTWAMANFVNTVLVAIGTEASLAIIGLSSMENATLGTTIYWAMNHEALLNGYYLWIGLPVICIMILFFGLFMLSTGIVQHSRVRRGR